MLLTTDSGLVASKLQLRLARQINWVRLAAVVAAAALGAPFAAAQTPADIAMVRFVYSQQTSTTALTAYSTAIVVQIDFQSPPVSGTAVQLVTPAGQTFSVQGDASGFYQFYQEFTDQAQLTAAFPNGSYVVNVLGPTPTTTTFMFAASVPTGIAISNFDSLQSVTGTSASVTWASIPAAGSVEAIYLDLDSVGGFQLSSQHLSSARLTTGSYSNLQQGQSYSGLLSYVSFDQSSANAGQTNIAVGEGFVTSFPVLCASAATTAPAAPGALGGYAPSPTEVALSWQQPSGGVLPTEYKIERAADASFAQGYTAWHLTYAATSFTDSSVAAGTSYAYRVSAMNTHGTSVPSATVQVQTPTGTASGATKFANIATRAYCSTGNSVTIGGFVVSGPTSKRVLIRAVGPSLTAQGIGTAEVLLDPSVEVHQGTAVVASNDNWGDNANAAEITNVGNQIGATALLSTDTKSSALMPTLAPGVYSFVVSGKGGTSGIVLLEVYDADGAGGSSNFVNIATRAYSTSGNGVTIGGFVVSGGAPKRVLIRAVGPTLTSEGLGTTEVLSNPVVELHQGTAIIATNDNWADNDNAADIFDTSARIGATPFANTDMNSSALLLSLPPGVYSFIARGRDNNSGVVLVEVYDAD